ncbi:MAG: hypothetical protein D6744_18890, partial [Planctomycetota bacterium]
MVAGCASPRRVTKLTEDQRAANLASFDHVWRTVRDKHYDPELGGIDWEGVRAELRPRVEAARSIDEARAVMREMIGRLGESHFAIIPADVYTAVDAAETSQAKVDEAPGDGDERSVSRDVRASSSRDRVDDVGADKSAPVARSDADSDSGDGDDDEGDVGLDLRVVDGQALVVRVNDGSPAAVAGVRPGWVLTQIDGRPIAPIIETLSAEYAGSSLRELVLTQAVARRLHGEVGEPIDLVMLDGEDREQTLTLTRARAPGKRAKLGNMPPIRVECEWRWLRDDIGYIRLSLFFDPPMVMRKLNQALSEMRDARGVIFDLRGNGGGIGAMAMGISGLFVRERGRKLGTMITRDNELKFAVFARPTAYQGPLAILVDGASASTSEIFAGGMQALGRARVFGTPTAGAALPSIIERLPNGDGFQYAFANYVSEDGTRLEGHGVVPDEAAPPNRADLLAGRDPAIEAAIRWIPTYPSCRSDRIH